MTTRSGTVARAVAAGVLAWSLAACESHDDRELWRFQTFRQRFWHGWCSATEPVVQGDRLYVGGGYAWDRKTRLYALDRHTGRALWTTATGGRYVGASDGVTHRALTLAGDVLLATIDEELVAFARNDGRRLWSRPATRPPRTANGEMVYTAAGSLLMALDLETGAERWRVTLAAPLQASPQLVGDRLYFGFPRDSRLHVVDRSTGRALEPLVLPGFNGHAVAAAGKILASAARNGRRQTYEIDPETGGVNLMDKGLLAVQKGVAYFDIGGGGVEAVDVSSRRSVASWRNQATAHRGGILVSGELLYQQDLSGDAGVVHAYALADGRRLWSFRTGDWVQGSVATPEALYLSSEDCHLYAVRPGR